MSHRKRGKLFLLDNRSRYAESYGRARLAKPGTVTISKPVEKILVHAICSKCGKEGMAYEDPNNPKQKRHKCVTCKVRGIDE